MAHNCDIRSLIWLLRCRQCELTHYPFDAYSVAGKLTGVTLRIVVFGIVTVTNGIVTVVGTSLVVVVLALVVVSAIVLVVVIGGGGGAIVVVVVGNAVVVVFGIVLVVVGYVVSGFFSLSDFVPIAISPTVITALVANANTVVLANPMLLHYSNQYVSTLSGTL